MLENSEIRSSFLNTNSINIGKSRRYSILRSDCEIDGYSAVTFFIDENVDYNIFAPLVDITYKEKNNKLFENLETSSRTFSNNIRNFIELTGFSFEDFFSYLNIDYNRAKLLLGRGESFPISICLTLERISQISLPLWFSFDLDVESVVKNWSLKSHQVTSLPGKYIRAAGSKVRLFESAVLFTEVALGIDKTNYILSSLQLNRNLFNYPDRNISIQLFRDFHNSLRLYGCSDDFFIRMGQYNVVSNKLTKIDLQQRVKTHCSKDVFLELGNTLCPRVDKNFDYEVIFSDDKKVIIFTKPREEMKKLVGKDIIGGHEVALYRFGHILQVPLYFGHKSACIEKSYMEYDDMSDSSFFHYYL
jgi:hypothetical protein